MPCGHVVHQGVTDLSGGASDSYVNRGIGHKCSPRRVGRNYRVANRLAGLMRLTLTGGSTGSRFGLKIIDIK